MKKIKEKDKKEKERKEKEKGNINKIKILKKERLNNYKDSLLEKEEKECTFFPNINDNYYTRKFQNKKEIKNKNRNNDIKITNIKRNNQGNNYETIYSRGLQWRNNICKKNLFIKKDNEDDEKFSFKPNINKTQNIGKVFQDNNYSDYWIKHNKDYIYRRLKNINKDKKDMNTFNSYLLNLKLINENSSKKEKNKNNRTFDININEQKVGQKININYIKKLLHEELQNTKSEDEDGIKGSNY